MSAFNTQCHQARRQTRSALRRRQVVAVLTGASAYAPCLVQAQPDKKLPIVGFLHPGRQALGKATIDALRQGMGEQGFLDDQTVRIDERWAEGDPVRLRQAARELVERGADVIVAVARPSLEAVLAASRTVPIVMTDLENDPVAMGWAVSVAKPGRNITGQFIDAPAMCQKWLQQIAELVPGLHKVGILWDASTGPYQRDAFIAAASAVRVETVLIEYGGIGTVSSVLSAGLNSDMQAIVFLGSPLFNQAGEEFANVLASRRLPGISPFRTFPDNGGLVSYGVDLLPMYRRLAPIVAKVLRGARPGDIPFERPTKFEFVLNIKTAKTLGLTVPPVVLSRADDVID